MSWLFYTIWRDSANHFSRTAGPFGRKSRIGGRRYQMGNAIEAGIDFDRGTKLEYLNKQSEIVGLSLERIQGPLRAIIETHRRAPGIAIARVRIIVILERSPGFDQLKPQEQTALETRLYIDLLGLGESALDQIVNNRYLDGIRCFDTKETMYAAREKKLREAFALWAAMHDILPENMEAEWKEFLRKHLPHGHAWYDEDAHEIWLYVNGPGNALGRNLLAHELGHAIDGPDEKYSKQDAWVSAWKMEIVAAVAEQGRWEETLRQQYARSMFGRPIEELTESQFLEVFNAVERYVGSTPWNALDPYANDRPREGFAEFIRMYMTGDAASRAWLKQTFPQCWEFLRSQGIIDK